jgi:methylated-DNA-[protein]-cysteine S-methyltransferase
MAEWTERRVMTTTLFTIVPSPIGDLLATGDGISVTGLYMEGHKRGPEIAPEWRRAEEPFAGLKAQLASYFEGELEQFDVPVGPRGSRLQMDVWDALTRIPYGTTTTYGKLAAEVGRPRAVRAVASAVARNPVSIVIPCHRVIGSNGSLTGFAGGLDRKIKLLELEGALREA